MSVKDSSECGLAPDFIQYFRIGCSELAQQFYTTAHPCIRSVVIGVGNGMNERAANSKCLEPLCLALILHGNRNRLGEMVLHFRRALTTRGVLTDVELEKLLPQYLKRIEQLNYLRWNEVGADCQQYDVVLFGVTQLDQVTGSRQGGEDCLCPRRGAATAITHLTNSPPTFTMWC